MLFDVRALSSEALVYTFQSADNYSPAVVFAATTRQSNLSMSPCFYSSKSTNISVQQYSAEKKIEILLK